MLHYRRPNGREFRALFTGDADEAREAQLLTSGIDLHADVLKVFHRQSLRLDAGLHRRGVGTTRFDLGGPPQHLRPPWCLNACYPRTRRRDDLPYRPLWRAHTSRRPRS